MEAYEHMKTHNDKGEKLELYYQLLLEQYLTNKNAKHMRLNHGITDLTTSEYHIEIKKWSNFSQVIGQLEMYQEQSWRPKLYAVFFGKTSEKNKELALTILKKKGIGVYEFNEHDQIIIYNEPVEHMDTS